MGFRGRVPRSSRAPGRNPTEATRLTGEGSESLPVLLVEDDVEERWLLSEILRSRGHTVTVCESAEAGLDAYREGLHPLVVLDWVLPGLSGRDFLRAARSLPHGKRSVIVVVTGKEEPTVLREVLDAGADDYVAKPVDQGLLNVRLTIAEREVRAARERERAESELGRKRREIQALFENLDEVFFSVDVLEEELIQISPAVRKVLGYDATELKEDPALWRRLLLPEGRQVLDRVSDLPDGESLTLEHSIDGSATPGTRWIEVHLKPERNVDGRVVRLDGIASDVSERKRSQEELASRNRELLTLHRISELTLEAKSLEQAYDDILGEISRATGFPIAAIETYDSVRERMVISAARGIPLPEDGSSLAIPLSETLTGLVIRTGRPVVESDARTRSEHGHRALRKLDLRTYLSFPMYVSGEVTGALTLAHQEVVPTDARLVRWGGSLANYLATFIDRKRSQEALRESEHRYRALAERLQEANQELETFAYSVSHDLRAPLRTMQGFAHTLLSRFGDELPEEGRDYLRRIVASGRQSEELIRDLLTYSRLSFEEVQVRPVDLNEVVQRTLEQLEADLRDAGARVEVEEDLPRVQGHSSTLIQVLSNLASNGIKFVPEGRKVRLNIHQEDRGNRVRLWVEDNGIGIPEDQQEKVFDAFERLTQTQTLPGTGIGLAIVRRGMERVGGTAGVQSTPGEGSRFWIELPKA